MKNIYSIIAVLIFAVFFTPADSFASSKTIKNPKVPPSVIRQIDEYVGEQIDADEADNCVWESEEEMKCRESEFKKARQFRYGDVNSDGRKDIVVRYVLEGLCCGNNSRYYLAVFLNTASGYKMAVSREIGRRGVRFVHLVNVERGIIRCEMEEYLPDDPMCCPSVQGKTFYILKNDELIEQNPAGNLYSADE